MGEGYSAIPVEIARANRARKPKDYDGRIFSMSRRSSFSSPPSLASLRPTMKTYVNTANQMNP